MNKHFRLILVAALLILTNGFAVATMADSKDLEITPRLQETPNWCWLTVGQMIFEHYEIPAVNSLSYQCGIVAAFGGPRSVCWSNCGNCPYPAGSFQNVVSMLTVYPKAVAYLTRRPMAPLTATLGWSPLSKSQIKNELDNNRPVIVGISPSGFPKLQSEHVALIVAYDEDEEGNLTLTVNDPFPYDLPQFARLGNPYEKADADDNGDGSYDVDYDDFKRGLIWRETIYRIQYGSVITPRNDTDSSSSESEDSESRETKIQECMEERVEKCIETCMDRFGHSHDVCKYQMCSLNPLNVRTWRPLCVRKVDRH